VETSVISDKTRHLQYLHYVADIHKVEEVERTFTKVLYGCNKLSYRNRLTRSNLPSLSEVRPDSSLQDKPNLWAYRYWSR